MPASLKSRTVIHLRPTAELAERVLLPGDPGRALMLAQLLLDKPLMFNHHRGLWGYTGAAAHDGQPLTVQSTGMGGPSAAIVLHELIELGATRAIRVGTCGALDPSLRLGQLVVAREAICTDGTSAALGAGGLAHADPALSGALERELRRNPSRPCRAGRIVSTDLFYEQDAVQPGRVRGDDERDGDDPGDGDGHGHGDIERAWLGQGALAVEMEAATLFALGAARGIPVGCVLAVSDLLGADGERTRIGDHALTEASEAMGAAAAAALEPSSLAPSSSPADAR